MPSDGHFFVHTTPGTRRRKYTLEPGKGSVGGCTRGAGAPPASLPCLYSNNSTETGPDEGKNWNTLQGNHKKTATILALHVERLVSLFRLETVGMLTLTFSDHVTDAREAQRRMNSLLTHIIRPRYREYIAVMERTKAGRIHFHLLVSVGSDIKTGLDFQAVQERDYKSASPSLRAEWAYWRRVAPSYGFGRTELLPIKSTVDAVKFYVGKYISKHIENREEEDKGVRLVRTSNGVKAGTTRFAWNSDAARLWREKLGLLCEAGQVTEGQCHKAFGSSWAYKNQDIIQAVKLPSYASPVLEELDHIPRCFERSATVMEFYLEHGKFRMTPEEALLAIGLRRTEGRKRNFEIKSFDEEKDDEHHDTNPSTDRPTVAALDPLLF